MASAGTAYVDIRPDFDPLTRGLREKFAEIGRRAAMVGVDGDTDPLERAVARTVARIRAMSPTLHVNVDIDRGLNRTVRGVESALEMIPRAAGAAADGIQGFFIGLTRLGPLLTGIAITIGAALAPVLLVLSASLANAVIGAGALATALAALAGPVVLVAVAALARFAAILSALKEHQQQATQQGAAVAGAQDQIRSATEALANAQANLAEQTTTAYRAWQDSIEAVKDDLLGVQQAQAGVDDANLSLREAQKALRDFKSGAGDAAGSLDGLFKKFTDVSIDFDPKVFENALAGAGSSLSGDDELKLERLILNVRDARLRQKAANDQVHDSNTKLSRDRKVENDFIKRGIEAYGPYRAAVQGVATAERQRAAALRQSNTALDRQGKLWDQLSPSEQRFAKRLDHFQEQFRRAFGPATRRLLKGFGDLLDTIGETLNKPGFRTSLAILGAAIGSMLRGIAREIRRKEFQEGFERFTTSAAHLIRSLGSNAIRSFLRLLMRVATEALPVVEDGLRRAVHWFDRLVSASNKPLADKHDAADSLLPQASRTRLETFISGAIDSFKTWIGIIKDLGRILGGFFRAVLPDGDKLASNLGTTIHRFANWVNDAKGQTKIRKFFQDLVTIVGNMADKIRDAAGAVKDVGHFLKDSLEKTNRLKGKVQDIFDRPFGGVPNVLHRASGGVIPGGGDADNVPLLGTPGEYVITKKVVNNLGLPFLNALNAGVAPAAALAGAAGGRAEHHHHGDFHMHAAPGATGFDAIDGVVRFAREIERRGGR